MRLAGFVPGFAKIRNRGGALFAILRKLFSAPTAVSSLAGVGTRVARLQGRARRARGTASEQLLLVMSAIRMREISSEDLAALAAGADDDEPARVVLLVRTSVHPVDDRAVRGSRVA